MPEGALGTKESRRVNVVAYLRVSTVEQADSGLGLAAQRATIEAQASYKGWHIVNWCVDAGATGKDLDRPGLHEALSLLRCKQADALVVAKLDRASRSVVDFAGLLEVARREGWAFVAIDLNVDTSTPTGELLANVMMSVAQWERRTIGLRTKEALEAKRRAGYRLGRPVVLPADVRAAVQAWRAAGCTLADVAALLNERGVPTAHGGQEWRPSTVRGVERSLRLDEEVSA
jgi:DNA invertase Pin-like site-specific DNA recombinase